MPRGTRNALVVGMKTTNKTDPTITAAFRCLLLAEQDLEAFKAENLHPVLGADGEPNAATCAALNRLELIRAASERQAYVLKGALWTNESARFRATLLADLLEDLAHEADAEAQLLRNGC